MKSKSLSLLTFAVFAFLIAIVTVSAVTSTVFDVSSVSAPTSVSENEASFIFKFDINYHGASEEATISFGDSTTSIGNIVIPSVSGLNGTLSGGDSREVTGIINGFSNAGGQTLTVRINASVDGTSARDDQTTFSVQITNNSPTGELPSEAVECSDIGNPGDLEIKSIDFQNNGMQFNTFGKDDEWFPLEEIEAEIKVENNGDYDVDDIEVSWGIWDIQGNDWVLDFDKEDEVNIKDGDEETFTVTFKIDEKDLDVNLDELVDDTENYKLYVVASGTIDDNSADELDGEDTCAFNEDDEGLASVVIESDFVVLDNFNVPTNLQCGENVELRGDVWNIGDRDQDDVLVRIIYDEFDIEEQITFNEVKAFDNEQVSFNFAVPNNAEERIHSLRLEVYDEDFDPYENNFDDDKSIFIMPLIVDNCGPSTGDVIVTASIISGGRAGDALSVRSTITNNGNSLRTFSVSAAGFESWASSANSDVNSLSLAEGQSGNTVFTINVNKDASGEQTFFIDVISDGELTRQPVQVNIEPRGGFGITGNVISGGALPWVIGLLNIILIVIIIIVAVRLARK